MVKKAILCLAAIACFAGPGMAQTHTHHLRCYTDEVHARLKTEYPDVQKYEAELEATIRQKLQAMDLRKFARTTDSLQQEYQVPIVFHIIHDYGNENISEEDIHRELAQINKVYGGTNAEAQDVSPTYAGMIPGTNIRYVGNPKIEFRLATKDPQGKPTRGVTRRHSYLTRTASDQAKFDLWPPDSYLNIWVISTFASTHADAAAYAYKPAGGAANPYGDGIITRFAPAFINNNNNNSNPNVPPNNTLAHEIGHVLNLDHTWGGTNNPEIECGDDGVDDTPPTYGHEISGCLGSINPPNRQFSLPVLADTFCTQQKSFLGRLQIPPALIPSSEASTSAGIRFTALSDLTIGSLDVYPSDIPGTPLVIRLLKDLMEVDSYSDVVTATGSSVQRIPVNFNVPAGGNYMIVFGNSVLALKDVIGDEAYPKTVPGLIRIESDTTNGRYNYFYNWSVAGADSAFMQVGKSGLYVSGDKRTDRGISFTAPTRIIIDSVDIYPTDTLGAPFTISVRKNGHSTAEATYSGVTTTRFAVQRVPVKLSLPAHPNGYKITFDVNPGALRDTPHLAYVREIEGAFENMQELSADGRYNYFYNMVVIFGYFKKVGDQLIDYPDTVNAENIMDYTYCARMFTSGQADRMRAALESGVAGRNNLISENNLAWTGALSELPDLPPVADFAFRRNTGSSDRFFGCANGSSAFHFMDASWNDTIISRQWTFSNGASQPTATGSSVAGVTFTEPGWVNVSLTVEGNNTGSSTITRSASVYVTDPNPTPALGYFQEFNPDGDVHKWPSFNYYNNSHRWEVVNVGFYDDYSIRYRNYDNRMTIPAFYTGTPSGDYDDFFSPVFDLSGSEFQTHCNLNFMSAGAFRTSNPLEMHDSLEIHISTNCGDSWRRLAAPIERLQIGNNGMMNEEFMPGWMGQWKLQSLPIAPGDRASNVIFRFRYRPGTFDNMLGSGNHFYMDRIHVSNFPTGVDEEMVTRQGMVLTPNPTTGGAHLVVSGVSGTAHVQVSDVTGKVVYRVEKQLGSEVTRIEIPASSIAVKGVYMVQLVSGNSTKTERLVVQ